MLGKLGKCKTRLEGRAVLKLPGGTEEVVSTEVYYHRAGCSGARYDHLDVVLESEEFRDILSGGNYPLRQSRKAVRVDLSKLVKGAELIIEFLEEVKYFRRGKCVSKLKLKGSTLTVRLCT